MSMRRTRRTVSVALSFAGLHFAGLGFAALDFPGLGASGAELQQLGFMSGHWLGAGGEPYEEVWLEPRDGTLPGTFRWVIPDGRQVLEFLVIEETQDGVYLRFKHFDTDYVPWEAGEPHVYRLTAVAGSSATFERVSSNTDAPRTLFYKRDGDTLTFRGTGDHPEEDPLVLVFTRR